MASEPDDTRAAAKGAAESRPNGLRRMLRRFTASEAEIEAEELQRDVARHGCQPAREAERGQLVSVTGRLRTVVYTPRTTVPTLEADLYDGSDVVTLVWLGRRQIAGIEPGRALTARGRVALRDDRKVIYNPYYELEAAP
ncbi:OB-fold nucleic acid binding domain-containing protein [Luedemannella flava]|uniref:OB-fold nucleic acid binding domain-containing protein n=1 Tax=Luedemannella flava TaxID=349316 RepID=A0ABP4YMQ8_9ACTN